MLRTKDGKPVKFVAQPELAPKDQFIYARPDDLTDQGANWRDLLLRYNADPNDNQFGLLPACVLYTPTIYQELANSIGRERMFILSAGWGLIGANFLTPDYDITFSAAANGADSYKRRKKGDGYADFSMLPKDVIEPIFFFGGNDYLPHFLALTSGLSAPRTVFYASAIAPDVHGCNPVRFETTRRTNWHYSCAEAFLAGDISNATL